MDESLRTDHLIGRVAAEHKSENTNNEGDAI